MNLWKHVVKVNVVLSEANVPLAAYRYVADARAHPDGARIEKQQQVQRTMRCQTQAWMVTFTRNGESAPELNSMLYAYKKDAKSHLSGNLRLASDTLPEHQYEGTIHRVRLYLKRSSPITEAV